MILRDWSLLQLLKSMKPSKFLISFTLLLSLCAPSFGQSLKVGTVDFQKILKSYNKAEQGAQELDRAAKDAQGKIREKIAGFEKGRAEVAKLEAEINKPELSKEARDAKAKQRDEKIAELSSLQNEIRSDDGKASNDLNSKKAALIREIYEDVMKVVGDKVKAENYQLVIDKNAPSANMGLPTVLYANKDFDFTDEVIATLNKNRPKQAQSEPAAKAAPKAESPAKKK